MKIKRDKLDSLVIEVPMLPPRELSPNVKVHWAVRGKARRAYQEAVYFSIYALPEIKQFGVATVNLTFIFPVKRRRDKDNLIASFKAGLDTLVHAEILCDDSAEYVTIGGVTVEVDKALAPRTIIEIVGKT